ncbi:hypothetical protein DPMN_091717 [Dreissena polymorpha]|uniref:Uncharacterized protein n=1 Tax=Dreissena polymorpha TaxID=45954 RepID=A0A9D4L0X0_DREPO|nr:hypothetical protein DPMN_091717 [Dreissena polymorpha]
MTDHHCGPTAIRMFMELKGPKHSKTAASMLMMLVEEQSTTKHRLDCIQTKRV